MVLAQSEDGKITEQDLELSLYTYKALCLKVIDGDTADLDFDMGMDSHRYERVRFYGINAPETHGVKKDSDEYKAGMKSTDRVKELLTNRQLWVETVKDKTGKYGRYLATIWVVFDGKLVNVNELLVEEGLAVQKTY